MNPTISPRDVLTAGPVIPVLVVRDVRQAVPLARALLAGGIRVLEITLRTDCALEAIRRIRDEVPEALVGAGTVVSPADLEAVAEAGGLFAISPGLTGELLQAAAAGPLPLVPGIATVSELMTGLQHGLEVFKFFPAGAAGGPEMLRAIGGPFPDVGFCPTGGINAANYRDYLALDNVLCVGGSWLAPRPLLQAGDWDAVTRLAREVAGS